MLCFGPFMLVLVEPLTNFLSHGVVSDLLVLREPREECGRMVGENFCLRVWYCRLQFCSAFAN